MLTKIADFINNNPIIIIVGFIFSLIGTIEVLVSIFINIKTRKEKRKFEEAEKSIFEYLKNKKEFEETSSELEKAKKDLKKAQNEMQVNLPRILKEASLKEQMAIEEENIKQAQERMKKLSIELDKVSGKSIKENNWLFQWIIDFTAIDKTKNLAILLIIISGFLLLVESAIGGIVSKILGVLGLVFIAYYVYNGYEIVRTKKWQNTFVYFLNIVLHVYFINVVFRGDVSGVIWWAVLTLLLNFVGVMLGKKIDVISISSILCIPIFMAVFIINSYETVLIITVLVIQILLILLNILNVFKTNR